MNWATHLLQSLSNAEGVLAAALGAYICVSFIRGSTHNPCCKQCNRRSSSANVRKEGITSQPETGKECYLYVTKG